MMFLDHICTVPSTVRWANGTHLYYKLIVSAVLTLLWVTATVSHGVFGTRVALTVDASGLVKDWQA